MNSIFSVAIPSQVKFGTPFLIEIEYDADHDSVISLAAEFDADVSPPSLPALKGRHKSSGNIKLIDHRNHSQRRTIVVVAQLGASVARSNGTDASS